ncbi:MAG TPA: sn-glycerol-3-phosphate ABC transporter ATP-binding protein UgpC [Trinickia sp.]|nr:sn-glycerol-3-phosphate ABC transporter ATP-binding protein UgpC [Trinickia sp.]
MSAVQLQQIRKTFSGAEVLKGVDIEVNEHEFLVFVGPSGCGKSTLLRTIAGLERVDSGRILIGGEDVTEVEPSERGVAMVFQSYALYPHMSVYENIAFGLRMLKMPQSEIDRRVNGAAQILQIGQLLERRPRALSGGQRQRVAIGRAIVREPKVFLFDEPLSNLDAALRVKMRLEFARLHDELKTTMIYVTHDQVEAMTLADKIVVLSAGNLEQVGSPNVLYHAPANRFVAGFIGSPKMNFLEGVVQSVAADGVLVRYETGETQRANVEPGRAKEGDKVTVGIRPEHMHVDSTDFGVSANVMAIESLGDAAYLYAECPVAPDGLIARIPPLERHQKGKPVKLGATPEHCHLFDSDGLAFQRKIVEVLAA